jgi:hypothetical protein
VARLRFGSQTLILDKNAGVMRFEHDQLAALEGQRVYMSKATKRSVFEFSDENHQVRASYRDHPWRLGTQYMVIGSWQYRQALALSRRPKEGRGRWRSVMRGWPRARWPLPDGTQLIFVTQGRRPNVVLIALREGERIATIASQKGDHPTAVLSPQAPELVEMLPVILWARSQLESMNFGNPGG